MIKRIECEGVGDNDGFFEMTPQGSNSDLSALLCERETGTKEVERYPAWDSLEFGELVLEITNLEREYHRAMKFINNQAMDIHNLRKRVDAIKSAASYRNMGAISHLALLADIEKIAQNALDEPPTGKVV